jgi:magnesium chelatase family protein
LLPSFQAPLSGIRMLACLLPTMLVAMTFPEALDTTLIDSIPHTAVITTRLCRAPHQTLSAVGLIGGGQVPRPGEVSRAHHGILFLDELPEFRRHVLEVLRQPLEESLI